MIVSTDIVFMLSTTGGSAGNSQAQPNPNLSLGTWMSTSAVASGSINNLFDNISGAENAASTTDYRCVFIYNSNPTLTLQAAITWISAEVPGGADIYIGVDPAPASPIGQATAQAASVGNELTSPTGVAFTNPTTKASGVSMGDIPPGQCRAIWLKRSATNSTALSNDGVTIRVEGDTAS